MGLDQIIPTIFLLLILILVLPSFLKTNLKLKRFSINLFIWSIIVVSIMIVSYLIF